MKLEIFNNLINNAKDNKFVQNFMKELSDYLENLNNGEKDTKGIINDSNNKYREEDCLYQVVELTKNGVYLQNTNNNKVFKETNMPKELMDKIGNDYILRYKNGEYFYEEQLTDKFFNKLVDINEYQDIQENFIKESNIDKIDSNMRYNIKYQESDYTILEYDGGKTLKVPNELIPFFVDITSILYYEDGKFQKNFSNI